MLKSFGISPGELRGIGVQMQKLEPIKAEGTAEGSQRRLPFKIGPAAGNLGAQQKADGVEDPIKDDVKSPQKPKLARLDKPSIPVDVVNSSTPTKKQLNTLGTQFVLPTQVDPFVLAELPDDIRSKLSKRVKHPTESIEPEEMPGRTSEATSRSHSPATQIALPTHSQLDPSILEALPEDVRAEVLGFYRTNSASQSKPKASQALLPQSPRTTRTLAPPKAGPSKAPTKRKRGGSSLHGKLRAAKDESTTLTQANFVSRPETTAGPAEPQQELDPEFLAALPDDIRAEVLAQHRAAQLQRKGGIDLSLHARKQKKRALESAAKGQPRRFKLPPRADSSRPTFTSRKLSTLPELREAMGAWYREFSDEGPYEEDTEALVSYLRRVVGEERDVQKAVGVVRWLTWLHSEGEGVLESDVRERWDGALDTLRGGVQDAVKERGMPGVNFG
jgi:DNA repair protein REV1